MVVTEEDNRSKFQFKKGSLKKFLWRHAYESVDDASLFGL